MRALLSLSLSLTVMKVSLDISFSMPRSRSEERYPPLAPSSLDDVLARRLSARLLSSADPPTSARSIRLFILLTRNDYQRTSGKGGKNRRRGKNEAFEEKRDLEFKEHGQGTNCCSMSFLRRRRLAKRRLIVVRADRYVQNMPKFLRCSDKDEWRRIVLMGRSVCVVCEER